jgi:hypothetical protein
MLICLLHGVCYQSEVERLTGIAMRVWTLESHRFPATLRIVSGDVIAFVIRAFFGSAGPNGWSCT